MDMSNVIGVPIETERHRPSQREAFEAAKVALAAQGLEMTPFGVETNERVIAGEITEEEAEEIILAHYRARNPVGV
jgi:hypothetical protein